MLFVSEQWTHVGGYSQRYKYFKNKPTVINNIYITAPKTIHIYMQYLLNKSMPYFYFSKFFSVRHVVKLKHIQQH